MSFALDKGSWRHALALTSIVAVGVPFVTPADAQEASRDTRDRARPDRSEESRVVAFGGRPRLGVSLETGLDGVADAQGARIRAVLAGSPAEEAGLVAGDIVVTINGLDLTRSIPDEDPEALMWDMSLPAQRLQILSRRLEPGDTVDIVYLRDGGSRMTRVMAGGDELTSWTFGPGAVSSVTPPGVWITPEAPDARGTRSLGGPSGAGYRGLELAPLNEGLGAYFGTTVGVLVVDVGRAGSLGLRAGDVIRAIGGRQVDEPADVVRILSSYERRETVVLEVVRHRESVTIEGTPG